MTTEDLTKETLRKGMVIPLYNFKYSNKPFPSMASEPKDFAPPGRFLGRVKEIKTLLDMLLATKNDHSSCLISGFRGVGKTSFVNEVLRMYCKKIENDVEVVEVRINLGTNQELTPKDVMINMIVLLRDQLTSLRKKRTNIFYEILSYFIITIVILPVYILGFIDIANIILFSTILILIGIFIYRLYKFYVGETKQNIIFLLSKLENDISRSKSESSVFKLAFLSHTFKVNSLPMSINNIETQLIKILNMVRKVKNKKLDIIFIFDELDKISGKLSGNDNNKTQNEGVTEKIINRMNQVNNLLAGLKNLITSAPTRMIFIAGREMYDSYLSDSGNASSLYESLFNQYIYIPSFLSDDSDQDKSVVDSMVETYVCSRLYNFQTFEKTMYAQKLKKDTCKIIQKNISPIHDEAFQKNYFFKLSAYTQILEENKRNNTDNAIDLEDTIFILKIFIHFLTLYSWGNIKKINTLYEQFVGKNYKDNKDSSEYVLVFNETDIQRFISASQLYILFHHNLSRTLTHSDDKLVVSSFSVFHYILKFHRTGFSRGHISRMYDSLNIHSSPEISMVIDTILNKVIRPYVRRIRNGLYRYRFTSIYEQEINYITSVSDQESASFNFSLNSMLEVRQEYSNMLDKINSRIQINDIKDNISKSEIIIIIGNILCWEQSYDEASIYYSYAAELLKTLISEKNKIRGNLSVILLFFESLLKKANMVERNGNYSLSAGIYKDLYLFYQDNSVYLNTEIPGNDSKWNLIKQPYWAMLYINLKRSPSRYLQEKNIPPYPYKNTDKETEIYNNSMGSFLTYLGRTKDSNVHFLKVINDTNILNISREKNAYIGGLSAIKLGLSLVYGFSSSVQKHLYYMMQNDKSYDQQLNVFIEYLSLTVSGVKDINNLNTFINKVSIEEENKYTLTDEIINVCNSNFIEDKTYLSDKAEIHNNYRLYHAIGLILIGAQAFKKCELYSQASQAYITVVMIWNLYMEIIPYRAISEGSGIREQFMEAKWVQEAIEEAFICQSKLCEYAYSHSVNTLWMRVVNKNQELPNILDFLSTKGNGEEHYLSWHYSVYAQIIVALGFWEDISRNTLHSTTDKAYIKKINIEKVLPYSSRFYATMLWVKGRYLLSKIKNENQDLISRVPIALTAQIHFYHAYQYIEQSCGNDQNIMMPPQFLVNYNMWELIYELVKSELIANATFSYSKAKMRVKCEMNEAIKHLPNDVSSRVFDLSYLAEQAISSLKTIENIGDVNSKARKEVFSKKYYLDDDFEDLFFNLDWLYCRGFGAGASICRMTVEKEMKQLIGLRIDED